MSAAPTGETLLQIRDSLVVAIQGAPVPEYDIESLGYVASPDDNPQTNLDRAVHSYLSGCLPGIFDAPILSEEGDQTISGQTRWNIDPVDGTYNYWVNAVRKKVNDLLPYAFSVGLQNKAARSLVGIIGIKHPQPGLKDDAIYSAVARMGAWKNGAPLFANMNSESGIVAFGHPGPQAVDRTPTALSKLWKAGIQTRQFGSACVDICRVTDEWSAFFEFGLKSWDIAAAVLIAKEAGCAVRVVPTGEQHTYDVIVARNRRVLKQVAQHTGITRAAAIKGWLTAAVKRIPR